MKYSQKVNIRRTDFKKVVEAFSDISFVKFLTYLQPIRIIDWSGIDNSQLAFFKLWFFGWKNFKVKHFDYKTSSNELSFIDKGVELPLGIKTWNHKHIVRRNKKVTTIIDILDIEHTNIAIGYILFPVLVFPILIRKFLYKMYFFN